jgi:hypothetical protein
VIDLACHEECPMYEVPIHKVLRKAVTKTDSDESGLSKIKWDISSRPSWRAGFKPLFQGTLNKPAF